MKRILFFGECMLEESGRGKSFGGDTLNTAVYLSRLLGGADISVGYATAMGMDNDSDYLLSQWQTEGLDTSLVRRIPDKLPGRYRIYTNANGERRFEYWRDDSAARYYFDVDPTPMEQALANKRWDYLYLSGISLAILADEHKHRLLALVRAFRQQGGRLIFDNNYRPQLWHSSDVRYWYSQIMHQADLALLTDEDETAIYGEQQLAQIMERCLAHRIPELVIKRGGSKALVLDKGGIHEIPAERVEDVVDTSAAGDAFAAGFLSLWLQDAPGSQAAEAGHRLAARVIQHHGAIIEADHMQDLTQPLIAES
ncbi:sugar kinase [Lacimicrobium alkaliphilum]|uniref:2-dehydro-3-deoxygluconokinase n=1 Tax=Lacimicrobium alkaliphilum TaxID=1526571 RepID=A0ABQ1RAK2_9ALTE|nr:sugar kinase [Lacimicrobium alkaliphilum]GGD59863.1 2-dehydro-3-deoxygluconokinase [Lacimicrobium alkaliphilum]